MKTNTSRQSHTIYAFGGRGGGKAGGEGIGGGEDRER